MTISIGPGVTVPHPRNYGAGLAFQDVLGAGGGAEFLLTPGIAFTTRGFRSGIAGSIAPTTFEGGNINYLYGDLANNNVRFQPAGVSLGTVRITTQGGNVADLVWTSFEYIANSATITAEFDANVGNPLTILLQRIA